MALLPPDRALSDGVVDVPLIDARDLQIIERASCDSEIAQRFGLAKFSAREYLARFEAALHEGKAAAFAVCDTSGECFGQVLIELRDAGQADVGYWLLAPAGVARTRPRDLGLETAVALGAQAARDRATPALDGSREYGLAASRGTRGLPARGSAAVVRRGRRPASGRRLLLAHPERLS